MDVTEAVGKRVSIRAFKPDPVPGALVRELLELAHRAPSGGNLQPWRVYALAGAALEDLKTRVRARGPEKAEYDVYPPNLWDPFRTRRFQNGEDLYKTIGIPREDRPARFAQLAKNGQFFGAPVGLFFCLDRKLGRFLLQGTLDLAARIGAEQREIVAVRLAYRLQIHEIGGRGIANPPPPDARPKALTRQGD